MVSISSRMFEKLQEKSYRDAFIASQIRRLIPKQLKAIRAAQNITQQELAEAARTTQTVISRIEKGGGSGNLTIKSLLNLANALDVALVIRFEPIDRHMEWTDNYSVRDVAVRKSSDILAGMQKAAARPAKPRSTDLQTSFDFEYGTAAVHDDVPVSLTARIIEFTPRPITPAEVSNEVVLLTGTHN